MSNIAEQRIYCAEQIYVPENLPIILKHYSKEIIRNQPKDILQFSKEYFGQKVISKKNQKKERENNPFVKPDSQLINKAVPKIDN
jgi:hypothetical protein